MSQTATSEHAQTKTAAPLWAMLFGNFLIGTGVLLPAGLLNDMSADFGITPAKAGLLSFVGGLVVGTGAPFLASLTSKIDRRLLLAVSLLVYALGHLAASVAPGFDMQLWLRALTIIGAAVFTPQAAATAGLLVPPEKRAAAIAFIFIGWSAASVAGIPMGSFLAPHIGWRSVYALMSVLCLAGTLAIWMTVPKNLHVQPLGLSSWIRALSSPALLLVYGVTLLSMSGQFTMFAYIAPMLRDHFAASATMISLAFLIVGAASVTGNSIATRIVAPFGVDRTIFVGLISLCAGFLGFGLFYGNYALAMMAGVFWGLGSFSSNSLQQSRLAALAPPIASATIALNTSVVYLGQSTGALVGGRLVAGNAMAQLPWLAFAFMSAAALMSLLATRVAARK